VTMATTIAVTMTVTMAKTINTTSVTQRKVPKTAKINHTILHLKVVNIKTARRQNTRAKIAASKIQAARKIRNIINQANFQAKRTNLLRKKLAIRKNTITVAKALHRTKASKIKNIVN